MRNFVTSMSTLLEMLKEADGKWNHMETQRGTKSSRNSTLWIMKDCTTHMGVHTYTHPAIIHTYLIVFLILKR